MITRAIVCDVGGVLIRTFDHSHRQLWADRLGISSPQLEDLVFNSDSARSAQSGEISAQDHWQWLGIHVALNHDELESLRGDFFRGDRLNIPLLRAIEELQEAGWITALLSNFSDDARTLWTDPFPLLHRFDHLFLSCEMGLMKPDIRIYHEVLRRLHCHSNKVIFIDDFKENIEGAAAVGLWCIHHQHNEETLKKLRAVSKKIKTRMV